MTTQTYSSNPFATTSTRIARFGSGGSRLRAAQPLTDDQLRAVAPSIFAEGKHESRSNRYSYIPTSEVVSSLRREGFHPFSVNQGGSRDAEKRNFTKHMIRFRHESAMAAAVGDHFREIVLVNSHDGTSSYQLMAGIFRLVCSNGMVVGDGQIEMVRVKHTGNVIPEVIEGCQQILQKLPEVSETVREWSGLSLTAGEQTAFAAAALSARYETDAAPIQPDQIITPRRREDAAPTLWNTLNTVQENIVRGGVRYRHTDERGHITRRRTREINGIDQDVGINRALWVLAREMQKIKASN